MIEASLRDSGSGTDLKVRDLLLRNVDLYAHHPAVACGDTTWSWEELARRAAAIAVALDGMGAARGDRVGLLLSNRPEFVEIAFAAALLGAVVVPINTRLARSEVRELVDDAAIDIAFVETAHAFSLRQAGRAVTSLDVDTDEYRAAVEHPPTREVPEHEAASDVFFQFYTSGTTGRPKGVMLTQRAMIQNALTIALAQNLRHGDVFLSATPLAHAAAGTRIVTLALDGVTHVILPRFTVETFADTVARHRVTTTILVPTMLSDLVEDRALDRRKLASLREIVYGAGPSSERLIGTALERLDCGLVQGWGLTEGSPSLTLLTADEHREFSRRTELRHRLRSVGRPVPGVRVRVVDDRGQPVPKGETGELQVRSTKSMAGYWGMPEATQETFADGWLKTGDLGYQDGDGYVFLVGREKEMIISGGINVYPSEIERVLLQHASVRDAAVVATADDRWGEVPIAFVTLAEGADGHRVTEELGSLCREELAGYKVPRRLVVLPELPRTSTGKVAKHELRDVSARRSRRDDGRRRERPGPATQGD